MNKIIHGISAKNNWNELSLMEQLGNVGSEVSRMAHWQKKDASACEKSFERALELLDFTIQDAKNLRRTKELARAREILCDSYLGGKEYNTRLETLEKYFFQFALAARLNKSC